MDDDTLAATLYREVASSLRAHRRSRARHTHARDSPEHVPETPGPGGPSIHPQITLLTRAFLKYLKEPRYQAPLSLEELAGLFANLYTDLNTLAVNLYTQLNSTKKHLIAASPTFALQPARFDYLLAIADFLALTVKLTKRTDEHALWQLRVFNYYKFLMVWELVEVMLEEMFGTTKHADGVDSPDSAPSSVKDTAEDTASSHTATIPNNTPADAVPKALSAHAPAASVSPLVDTADPSPSGVGGLELYHKIFSFDQKDIIYQEFLDDKLASLRALNLPLTCFVETPALAAAFSPPPALDALFARLNRSSTPLAKLHAIVAIQKHLIRHVADAAFDADTSAVNNDVLLPLLIFYIITHLPAGADLYLNLRFVRNFLNLVPDKFDLATFPANTSVHAYVPTDKLGRRGRGKRGSLYKFLHLEAAPETPELAKAAPVAALDAAAPDIFSSDAALVAHLQTQFLNRGELMFYLTNFEAVLFFLLNVTLDELKVEHASSNELLTAPLSKLVDAELLNLFKFPAGDATPLAPAALTAVHVDIVEPEAPSEDAAAAAPAFDSTAATTRSRLSSLFNTISTKISDARLRSNSSILNSFKPKETFPSIASPLAHGASSTASSDGDGESLQTSPVTSIEHHDPSLSMVKSLLGRFGLVLIPLFGVASTGNTSCSTVVPNGAEVVQSADPVAAAPASKPGAPAADAPATEPTAAASSTAAEASAAPVPPASAAPAAKIFASPINLRTRASSFTESHQKRNSITSKFTLGMNELMTKLNNANTNTSSLSLHSMEDTLYNADLPRRPEYNRSRTTSLQIMDKWISNLTSMAGTQAAPGNSTAVSLGPTIELAEPSQEIEELTRFEGVSLDSLTIGDLRTLKRNYDRLCAMVATTPEQVSNAEETSI